MYVSFNIQSCILSAYICTYLHTSPIQVGSRLWFSMKYFTTLSWFEATAKWSNSPIPYAYTVK